MYSIFFIMELSTFISKYKHLNKLKDSKKSPCLYFLLGDFVEYPLEFVDCINEFVSDIKTLLNSDILYSNYEFNLLKSFLNFMFDTNDILNLFPSSFEFETLFVVDDYFMGMNVPYSIAINDEDLSIYRNYIFNNNIVTSLSGFSKFSDFVSKSFASTQQLYVNCA